jgi:hypothetical protein
VCVHLIARQARSGGLRALKVDFGLVTILACGNDYLPAVRDVSLTVQTGGLWDTYLAMRNVAAWRDECAPPPPF